MKRRGFLKLLAASPVVAVPEFPRFAAQTRADVPITEVQESRSARDPGLIFENFVVGGSNRQAYEASIYAATHIGHSVEPLHICGDCGLGKTHLLYAIAHHVWQTKPASRIYIGQAERFISDYVEPLRSGRAHEFRRNILSFDIMLLDDLQYLAGKEVSQAEAAWFLARPMSAGPSIVTADALSLYELGWYKMLRADRSRVSARISEPETSLKILMQEASYMDMNFLKTQLTVLLSTVKHILVMCG
ncbi:MAG: DnaA ATPase domain-containing protein [Gammaproteobacteria bacterium]